MQRIQVMRVLGMEQIQKSIPRLCLFKLSQNRRELYNFLLSKVGAFIYDLIHEALDSFLAQRGQAIDCVSNLIKDRFSLSVSLSFAGLINNISDLVLDNRSYKFPGLVIFFEP